MKALFGPEFVTSMTKDLNDHKHDQVQKACDMMSDIMNNSISTQSVIDKLGMTTDMGSTKIRGRKKDFKKTQGRTMTFKNRRDKS